MAPYCMISITQLTWTKKMSSKPFVNMFQLFFLLNSEKKLDKAFFVRGFIIENSIKINKNSKTINKIKSQIY